MSNEDVNFDESDFKDFDNVADNIELDSDISEDEFDEEAIEKALQNVVAQMSPEESALYEAAQNQQNIEATQEILQEGSIFANNPAPEIQNETATESEENLQDTKETIIEETVSEEETEENNKEIPVEEIVEETQIEEEQEKAEIQEEREEKTVDYTEEVIPDNNIEVEQWEELNNSNDVVKKYIVYISKEFVPYIDNMSIDKRSAYINDAIQQKIDSIDEKKQKIIRRDAIIHFLIAVFAFIIMAPIGLFIANKAIIATFDNYKYSQENFEKLYRQRFEEDKTYIRSLEYNKEQEKKAAKGSEHSD